MIDFEQYFRSFKFNFTKEDVLDLKTNRYLRIDRDGLMYVRDFCCSAAHVDIDEYFPDEEARLFNENIIHNQNSLNAAIDVARYSRMDLGVVCCSGVSRKPKPGSLSVGVNDSLRGLFGELTLYLCNNPYASSTSFLPNASGQLRWPDGILSYRTSPKFVRDYRGFKMGYNLPANSKSKNLINLHRHHVALEDHRSPILSALNLMYLCGVREVCLSGFNNYLKEERPGATYIRDGMWMYPQQIIELSVISAGAFWLNAFGVEVTVDDEKFDFIDHVKPPSRAEIGKFLEEAA